MGIEDRETGHKVVVGHSLTVALTPLIPLPFVDDMAKGYLQRRMVYELAAVHDLEIWREEVRTLADDAEVSVMTGALKGAALMPLKLLLRKAFFLLSGKKIVDIASLCYHRGRLLDLTFAHGWCRPAGPRTVKEVRLAIDAVCQQVPIASSPVTHALRSGLEGSRDLLGDVVEQLKGRLGGISPDADERGSAHKPGGAGEPEGASFAAVRDRLLRSLAEVPSEHFEHLEKKLSDRLGPKEKLTP
jgi:hypothetical protein